jgi:DNA-binding FrmR family transcriptional regulator
VPTKSNQELIHRLNRAIGQLEAIKKTLSSEEDKDCIKTIRLLKAANNAIKKFGEAYVNDHLTECMLQEKATKEEMKESLKEVISSAFTM